MNCDMNRINEGGTSCSPIIGSSLPLLIEFIFKYVESYMKINNVKFDRQFEYENYKENIESKIKTIYNTNGKYIDIDLIKRMSIRILLDSIRKTSE